MGKIITVLLLLMLIGCKQTERNEEPAQSEEVIGNFINIIESDLIDDNINGSTSFAIVKENRVVASRSFGFINTKKENHADSNTIYRIGSITKSITGFLLLKLHQDNVLDLDDPVEKYLPEIKTLNNYESHPPVTFRQLASHTSGLDRESRNREVNIGEQWEEKVLMAIPETNFRYSPNERFSYSNIGYGILGLALSRAANKPYTELINEKILVPLEMTNTHFRIPEDKNTQLSEGMAGGPTAELNYELPLREHDGRGYRIPNGGLYSTPNDMAKFMIACLGYSDILNEENVQLLQTTQTPTTRLRSNYSYGFDIYSDQGIQTVGHGGSTPGYSAHFEFEKNSKYGIIIMRNYNFGNTNLDLRSNALLRKLTSLN